MWIILYVGFLSFLGGVTSYIRKKNNGTITGFSLSAFIGDMVIAGFVGVVTYLLCKGVGLNELLTAGLVGISSHMGTKAIVFVEQFVPKYLDKLSK
jgi:hypothetical protein